MKFFEKHFHHQKKLETEYNEFWDNTNYKTKNAGTFDKIEENTGSKADAEKAFFNDLLIPSNDTQNNPSNRIRAMPSKINPDLMVTDQQWVVSQVRKKTHAYIVVESLGFGNDQGLSMRWFDFLTKDKPNAPRSMYGVLTNLRALQNKTVPGLVRYCPTNNGNPLLNIPEGMSKHELFTKLNWNEDTDSWVCSPQNVKAMMKNIATDIKDEQGSLKFKFCGHTTPNCVTWAWSKLDTAGIDAKNYSHHNLFMIRASHNIGTKRHSP